MRIILLLFFLSSQASAGDYRWLTVDPTDTIAKRFTPPDGFKRADVPVEGFAHWLRGLPLKPRGVPVLLFNGQQKPLQSVHASVIDIDVGKKDLQQCADAVMRLRAEFLFSRDRSRDICFRFTSGDKARWESWREGARPKVTGNKVRWVEGSKKDPSYGNFRGYLTELSVWAGTASLAKELKPVADLKQIAAGDVFIQGGFPGHAVLVVDVARNSKGEQKLLLAQSYMPAQDIHILKQADSEDPWFTASDSGAIKTPEWDFPAKSLKRFAEAGCP